MKMSFSILSISGAILLLLLSADSYCNRLYVSPAAAGTGTQLNPAGFQTALNMARTNGFNDTLFLQAGVYTSSDGNFSYDTTANDNKNVLVSGGWDSNYSNQEINYTLTKLDGSNSHQVLYLAANKVGLDYKFYLFNLSIQNGNSSTKSGAGLGVFLGSAANNDIGNLEIYIDECNFHDNTASGNMSGGALYAPCYVEVTNSFFYSNSAYNGGALCLVTKPDLNQTLSPLVSDCYFEDNSNYGNQGSTIWHNIKLRFMNSTIKGRTDDVGSSGNGSGIWGNSGSFTIAHNCIFTKINIVYWGPAIQAFDGDMELVNCLFEGNKIQQNGYGTVAYYHNNGAVNRKIIITNCTFVGNRSVFNQAAAIHIRPNGLDSCIVTNCILFDNGSDPIEREFGAGYGGIKHSLVQGNITLLGFTNAGNNLNNVDPLFESVGNYHLAAGSPCIDAGTNLARSILPYDIEGTIRNLGGSADMGAYEYNRAPTAILLSETSINENSPANSIIGNLTATDPDAGDLHHFALTPGNGTEDEDNARFSISGSSLHILEMPNFEQKPFYHILLKATDSGGKQKTTAFIIAVNDLNEAPFVANPLQDLQTDLTEVFIYTLPENTFSDDDAGDVLTYSATLSNGNPLPEWLSFNGNTRTFTGTPLEEESLLIKVKATDQTSLSVSDEFELTIIDISGFSELMNTTCNVYPNPVNTGNLFVQLSKTPKTIQKALIYTIDGRLLKTCLLTSDLNTLNVSSLCSGSYLLFIQAGKTVTCSKFSVNK
jgi:hypothetical protein